MPNHRKPTALKLVQGTYRSDRAVNEAEPETPREIEPPKELRTKVAKELYVRLAEKLKPSGLFTVADELSLSELVRVELMLAKLEKKLKVDLMAGATGSPIADPRLPAYRDLLKIAANLRRGFGMDPESRSRIDVPDGGNDTGDGMEDILAGRG